MRCSEGVSESGITLYMHAHLKLCLLGLTLTCLTTHNKVEVPPKEISNQICTRAFELHKFKEYKREQQRRAALTFV
jgi:hypothetical protein